MNGVSPRSSVAVAEYRGMIVVIGDEGEQTGPAAQSAPMKVTTSRPANGSR